jgi:hypothetical protein
MRNIYFAQRVDSQTEKGIFIHMDAVTGPKRE